MQVVAKILLAFYLLGSVHLPINFHYCHEYLVAVSPTFAKKTCKKHADETDTCGLNKLKQLKKPKKDCCSDAVLELGVEHDDSLIEQFTFAFFQDIVSLETAISNATHFPKEEPLPFNKPPPQSTKQRLATHQSFQFYG